MTTERLYDLLDGLVVDLTPVDVVDTAWDRAHRTRQRRRLITSGGAAAAVVALAVGVAVIDGPDPSSGPPVTPPSQTPTPSPDGPDGPDRPDTTYAGIDIFWSPTLAEEAGLRWHDGGPVPQVIDLAAGAPDVAGEERVLAVFPVYDEDGMLDRVVALAPDGSSRSVDVSRLEPVRDEDGNAAALLPTDGGLSADGRHVFFAQDSSLEVYEFATDTWTTIDTPDWQAEGARWLSEDWIVLPLGTGYRVQGSSIGRPVNNLDVFWSTATLRDDAVVYGPIKSLKGDMAQSQRLAGPVEGELSNPEAVGVTQGDHRSALAFSDFDRAKGCCPVVGWLDAETVVYQSDGRLLAWRVGTHDVTRVAELVGGYGSGSWASLSE